MYCHVGLKGPNLGISVPQNTWHLQLLEVSAMNFYDKMSVRCRAMSGKCFKFVIHTATSIKMCIQNLIDII